LHGPLLEFLAADATGELKEVVIGHRFFDRPPAYDPKVDPVVRVEMRRLRERLEEYYDGEGADARWRLRLPKGAYQLVVEEFPAKAGRAAVAAPPSEAAAPATEPLAAAPLQPGRFGWWRAAGLAAALGALAWVWIDRTSVVSPESEPPIQSIAILEFNNVGEVPESLTAGLASEVATVLAAIDGLRIISPQAASRVARGSDRRTIANRLNAEALLEGSVESWNGRLRMQVRLVRAADDAILWAESDERTVVDPFVLQTEFATKVAAAVHRNVLRRSPSSRPVSAKALLAFRAGIAQMERWNGPALQKAAGLLESAVTDDPDFAASWAALCEVYGTLPDYTLQRESLTPKALAACRRALGLDPENANAWGGLGLVQFAREQNLGEGRRSLLKAISLNPNLVNAHRRLGLLYVAVRRFDEAQQHLEAAARLDPLAPMVQINLAELYQAKQDFPAAERVLRGVLDANPSLTLGRIMLAATLSMEGRCAEARAMARAIFADPEAREWHVAMASVQARCGDRTLARRMWAADDPPGAANLLSVYVGDWKRARKYFADAVSRDPMLALNIALDQRWLEDAENRGMFARLLERLQAAVVGGAQ
jgi:serine/threonine-protein kinase